MRLLNFRIVGSSLGLVCLVAISAAAAVIEVPGNEPTIQQAIDAASDGDLVQVDPGTYSEHLDFHGKAIIVQSERGPRQTIIDGSNTGTVVTFQSGEGADSVLAGFTIQHGSASFGAGLMLLGSSPTIRGNVFRDNAQGSGGFGAAIGGNVASPVIEQNKFVSNTCDAQFLSGVVSFVNGSSPLIANNIFQNNPCRAINMTLPTEGRPVVTNNTIVQNSVGLRVDARVETSGQIYANNILVGNEIGLQAEFLSAGNEPTFQNNLVFRNEADYSGIDNLTGIDGNISADPKFADFFQANFRLRQNSPAIDAGTLEIPDLPATDFTGNPRVVDGDGDGNAFPDIGAFEFIP